MSFAATNVVTSLANNGNVQKEKFLLQSKSCNLDPASVDGQQMREEGKLRLSMLTCANEIHPWALGKGRALEAVLFTREY